MAAFWCTFHHHACGGGGACPPPFPIIPIMLKVHVPAVWADTLTLFHLYPYVLCGLYTAMVAA
jgi:hypothetical protein